MMASGLNQYWKQRAPTGYVRNAPAYDALLAAIDKSHPIVELIGRHGSGKTMLLRSLADERPPIVEGAIEYFEGSPALPFAASIDSIAGSFGRAHGRCLLVVDEGELMPRTELLEGIARLSTGRWSFTVSNGVQTGPPIGVEEGPPCGYDRGLSR
jgi:ABC-type phosphate/phosphonate transport system ATPase subunit